TTADTFLGFLHCELHTLAQRKIHVHIDGLVVQVVNRINWPSIGAVFEIAKQVRERDDGELAWIIRSRDRIFFAFTERAILVEPQPPAFKIDHRKPKLFRLRLRQDTRCDVCISWALLLLPSGAGSRSTAQGHLLIQNNQTAGDFRSASTWVSAACSATRPAYIKLEDSRLCPRRIRTKRKSFDFS